MDMRVRDNIQSFVIINTNENWWHLYYVLYNKLTSLIFVCYKCLALNFTIDNNLSRLGFITKLNATICDKTRVPKVVELRNETKQVLSVIIFLSGVKCLNVTHIELCIMMRYGTRN